MGWKVTFTEEGANETANILISTNGNRAYEKVTELSNDGDVENAIVLIDQAKRQGWLLVPDESLKEDGKLGYYRAVDVSGIQIENKFVIKPADGIKFTQKTKGNYYIETQTFEQTVEEQTIKMVMSYCYVGNDSVPKYVEVKVSSGGKEATTHMEITSIEYKANTKYLDFETILKQYVNISDMLGAASMPSVAGLTIG